MVNHTAPVKGGTGPRDFSGVLFFFFHAQKSPEKYRKTIALSKDYPGPANWTLS
jgi:hypothetical protein